MTMKVKLRARRLWNAVDKGTDNEEDDMSALKAILAAVPAEYREPLGAKSSAKEAWVKMATGIKKPAYPRATDPAGADTGMNLCPRA